VPDTFEGFMQDYLALVRNAVALRRQEELAKQRSIVDACYDPFCSILIEDCVARGADMHQGGSVYPATWSIYAHGLGTLADSLSAVKRFVYDERAIGLPGLIEALTRNFEGCEEYEALGKLLDRATPAYGNDLDEPDALAARVFECFTGEIFKLNQNGENTRYLSTFFSYFSHVLSGEVLMATPNGRRKGEPLSDSMAPSQGKDVGGPTKMLNSVLKIDHGKVTGGYALNLKVNPSLVKTPQGVAALKALLEAYLLGDGPQIQINYVDIHTLREAQKNPDAHRNLIVRVGGYCEYFVNLDPSLQNEIINRTIHDAL